MDTLCNDLVDSIDKHLTLNESIPVFYPSIEQLKDNLYVKYLLHVDLKKEQKIETYKKMIRLLLEKGDVVWLTLVLNALEEYCKPSNRLIKVYCELGLNEKAKEQFNKGDTTCVEAIHWADQFNNYELLDWLLGKLSKSEAKQIINDIIKFRNDEYLANYFDVIQPYLLDLTESHLILNRVIYDYIEYYKLYIAQCLIDKYYPGKDLISFLYMYLGDHSLIDLVRYILPRSMIPEYYYVELLDFFVNEALKNNDERCLIYLSEICFEHNASVQLHKILLYRLIPIDQWPQNIDLETAKVLVNHGYNYYDNEIIINALKYGNLDVFEYIMELR